MMSAATVSVVVLLVLTILYLNNARQAQALARRSNGAAPVKRHSFDPLFGIDTFRQDIQAFGAKRLLPFLEELHSRYGTTFYETSIIRGTKIWTAHEKNIQTIFGTKSQEWGIQPPRYDGMRYFCGEGMLSCDGTLWEQSRSLFKPLFQKAKISDLTGFNTKVSSFLTRIPRDGSTVDLQELASTMFILGKPIGLMNEATDSSTKADGEQFLKEFQLSLQGSSMRMLLGRFGFLLPKSVTFDHWNAVHGFIDSKITLALDGEGKNRPDSVNNLLDSVLKQTHDAKVVRDQLIQGLMASLDTTAIMVSNTIRLLSRHADVWQRLRSEVIDIDTEELSIEDSKKHNLLQNVMKESLRIHGVFPILAREALVDTTLPVGGGPDGSQPIFCPKGTTALGNFWVLHRQESIYGKATHDFDPDRWNSIKPGPWQNLAFGGGQRACLGQSKALLEAACFIVRLAQTFERLESRDDREWAGDVTMFVKNVNGCKVGLFPA